MMSAASRATTSNVRGTGKISIYANLQIIFKKIAIVFQKKKLKAHLVSIQQMSTIHIMQLQDICRPTGRAHCRAPMTAMDIVARYVRRSEQVVEIPRAQSTPHHIRRTGAYEQHTREFVVAIHDQYGNVRRGKHSGYTQQIWHRHDTF
jgi:hypothetical protein